MKKILPIVFALCLGCGPLKSIPGPIKLTVTHVMRSGEVAEVWARRGYMVYMAQFYDGKLPDSVKRGTVITALPYGKIQYQDTSCLNVFKRIK